jgi:hypothetical protein
MSISKDKLNEYIDLYLNDVADYGSDKDNIIAENTLKPVKYLILESKKDAMMTLLEMAVKSNMEGREVIEDFILYLENL